MSVCQSSQLVISYLLSKVLVLEAMITISSQRIQQNKFMMHINKLRRKDRQCAVFSTSSHDYHRRPQLPTVSKITFVREGFLKALEIYRWRLLTSFPIVKALQVELSQAGQSFLLNAAHPSQIKTTLPKMLSFVKAKPQLTTVPLTLTIEPIICDLTHFNLMLLPQILHLIKECMAGFEVLTNIFGLFRPHPGMIVVNEAKHWKVWANTNYSAHTIRQIQGKQYMVIQQIVNICERWCVPTAASRGFFEEMYKEIDVDCTFHKILLKIRQFVSRNKIYVVKQIILPQKNQRSRPETMKLGYFSSYSSATGSRIGGHLEFQSGKGSHTGKIQFINPEQLNIFSRPHLILRKDLHSVHASERSQIHSESMKYIESLKNIESKKRIDSCKHIESIKHIESNKHIDSKKDIDKSKKEDLKKVCKNLIHLQFSGKRRKIKTKGQQKATENDIKTPTTDIKKDQIIQTEHKTHYFANITNANRNRVISSMNKMVKHENLPKKQLSHDRGIFSKQKLTSLEILPKTAPQRAESYFSGKLKEHSISQVTQLNEGSSTQCNSNEQNNSCSEDKSQVLPHEWQRNISSLFGQEASLQALKGSIIIQTAEDAEYATKYLMDIKLDKLMGYGRDVAQGIEITEQQLIEEQRKSMNQQSTTSPRNRKDQHKSKCSQGQ